MKSVKLNILHAYKTFAHQKYKCGHLYYSPTKCVKKECTTAVIKNPEKSLKTCKKCHKVPMKCRKNIFRTWLTEMQQSD